jgi:hypothetical protein
MGVLLLYNFSLRRPLLCCSSGAIKRHRLEEIKPTISYEHFVEDLDGGDSFTTSLIEILVKVRFLAHTLCRLLTSAIGSSRPTPSSECH